MNENANGRAAKTAKDAGLKRYLGTTCPKHPELNGERNARNRGCIGCNKDKMRARRAANPEYHRRATRVAYEKWYKNNAETIKAKSRKKRTGVDAETYLGLLRIQGNKCAICDKHFSEVAAHTDHCHDGGGARGILCGPCNQAEGLIKRSGLSADEFGRRLVDYLDNPPARLLKS